MDGNINVNEEQRYIRASMLIRELERKMKVSDEEYQSAVMGMDEEQRRQYDRDTISQSDYDNQMEELLGVITEIDRNRQIGQERLTEERDIEIARKREELITLRDYYQNLNDGRAVNIMFNGDYATMDGNLLLDEYERIKAALDNGTEKGYVGFLKDVRKANILARVKRRDNNNGGSGNGADPVTPGDPTGGNPGTSGEPSGDPVPPSPSDIEAEINKFNNAAENIEKQIKEIREKLVFGEGLDLDVTQAIRGLDTELKDLDNMGKLILDDIDEFKREAGDPNFSMTPAEIVAKVKGFRSRLNELKKTHKEKYNARVDLTNEKIRELKGMTDLDAEVANMIANLVELDKCEQKIAWNSTNYLNQIDYNKLYEVNKLIAEIEKKLGKGPKTPEVEGLDVDIKHIESEIQRISSEIVENMPQDEIDRLTQDILVVEGLINDFRQKLEANKDKISTEEYDKYKARADKAEADLKELRKRLGIKIDDTKAYDELVAKAKELGYDVDRLSNDIEDFFGKVVKSGAELYEARHNTLVGRVGDFRKEVEEKHKNGEIDENQYKSLIAKIDEMDDKLAAALNKLRDPGMVKGADIFEVINKDIDKLNIRLSDLEHKVDTTDKFKKDDRKVVDKEIQELEAEINRIDTNLERYKDHNPEKYDAAVKRMADIKNRLSELKKKYRAKCPFLVRVVRGAKDFYKKHKKACLVAAGLAAIALLHATVGPVLIPAIMHGNIMIGFTSPILRPFVEFSNNILGGMIGATMNPSSGAWFLANGVSLNPSVAATSLLKGLAISGIGSTMLIAPVIVAVKELINKMKTAEHKMKLVDAEKLKKKYEEAKGKLKDKKPKEKPEIDAKKMAKKVHIRQLELLRKYYKSGVSLEEFCEAEKLSEADKNYLVAYEASVEEEMKNTGKKGR